MILKKILLAYQPPGLGLVYIENNKEIIKHIDLPHLSESTNIFELTNKILESESSNAMQYKNIIHNGILKIQNKLMEQNMFKQSKNLLEHYFPITNIAINNFGDKCVTGSYDHTARIWNTETGNQLNTLGHKNVVFSVTFNDTDDKVLTGSFDKTAKLWEAATGKLKQTYWGHTDEVITAQFLNNDKKIVTASTDTSVRTFEIETAQNIQFCSGHSKEVVCLQVDKFGKFIISGSLDNTIRIWDARNGTCIHILCGHEAEISSCVLNEEGTTLVSGSFDGRIIVWDLRKMKYYKIFPTQTTSTQKIVDVALKENLVAGCSTEGRAYVFDIINENRHWNLVGHDKCVSKINFNPISDEVMTCSDDHTLRLWNLQEPLIQNCILEHDDEVFSCVYSKCGKKIISACKDNTCRIWHKK